MTRALFLLCLSACSRAPSDIEVGRGDADSQPVWLLGRGGQLLRMAGDVRQDHAFDAQAVALTRFDSYLAWATGAGHIWHSSDGGDSWTAQLVPTRERLAAVSFSSPTHGVAVGGHAVAFGTEDGGAHWRNLELPTKADLHAVKLARQSGIAIAAGDAGTLLRSSDSGRTWLALALPHVDALVAADITEDGRVAVVAGAHGRAHLVDADGISTFAQAKGDWLAARFLANTIVLAGQGGAVWVCSLVRDCRPAVGASEDLISIATHPTTLLLGRSGTVYRLSLSDLTVEPQIALSDALFLDDLGAP